MSSCFALNPKITTILPSFQVVLLPFSVAMAIKDPNWRSVVTGGTFFELFSLADMTVGFDRRHSPHVDK